MGYISFFEKAEKEFRKEKGGKEMAKKAPAKKLRLSKKLSSGESIRGKNFAPRSLKGDGLRIVIVWK